MSGSGKKKSYFLSKALIISLSLVILLNGLGLIVAGKKVNKKRWITAGVLYIVIEWICVILGVGFSIAMILYIASIIHTALICSDYGNLRAQKDEIDRLEIQPKRDTKNVTSLKQEDVREKKEETNVEDIIEKDESILFSGIQLSIGIAEVKGISRDNLKIKIQGENGKIYQFDTDGNSVKSFVINGKQYSYGG